jgi:hypothetical protein
MGAADDNGPPTWAASGRPPFHQLSNTVFDSAADFTNLSIRLSLRFAITHLPMNQSNRVVVVRANPAQDLAQEPAFPRRALADAWGFVSGRAPRIRFRTDDDCEVALLKLAPHPTLAFSMSTKPRLRRTRFSNGSNGNASSVTNQ